MRDTIPNKMSLEKMNISGGAQERVSEAVHQQYREAVQGLEGEELKNRLFNAYLRNSVAKQFMEHARDCDFNESEVEEIELALGTLSIDDALAALSLPFELREKWFETTLDKIESGESDIATAVNELVALGKKNGFSIGFHTSPVDIQPEENGRWVIKGSEKDHRDNDLTMAYYSKQYKHIFKQRNPQFIYVIRALEGERTDGSWYRAPSLSVIARLPFEEVNNFVEDEAREIEKERTQQREAKLH